MRARSQKILEKKKSSSGRKKKVLQATSKLVFRKQLGFETCVLFVFPPPVMLWRCTANSKKKTEHEEIRTYFGCQFAQDLNRLLIIDNLRTQIRRCAAFDLIYLKF